jgi:hypothetical protein
VVEHALFTTGLVEAVTGKKGNILHVTWEPRKLIDMIVTCVRIKNIFW